MDIQSEKLMLIEWISRLTNDRIIGKPRSLQKDYLNRQGWANEVSEREKNRFSGV